MNAARPHRWLVKIGWSSHCLNWFWRRSVSPVGIIRSEWFNNSVTNTFYTGNRILSHDRNCSGFLGVFFVFFVCVGEYYDYFLLTHYSDAIISAMASQIAGVSIVCQTVCSGQRKHQSSASLGLCEATGGFPSQRFSNAKTWYFHLMTASCSLERLNGCNALFSPSISLLFLLLLLLILFATFIVIYVKIRHRNIKLTGNQTSNKY